MPDCLPGTALVSRSRSSLRGRRIRQPAAGCRKQGHFPYADIKGSRASGPLLVCEKLEIYPKTLLLKQEARNNDSPVPVQTLSAIGCHAAPAVRVCQPASLVRATRKAQEDSPSWCATTSCSLGPPVRLVLRGRIPHARGAKCVAAPVAILSASPLHENGARRAEDGALDRTSA